MSRARAQRKRTPPAQILAARAASLDAPAAPPNRIPVMLRYAVLPICLLTVIIFLTLCSIEEYDIWFHMAFARYVLRHHAFPPGDVFSFTSPGREWISTGWLASIILYWLWDVVGRGVNPAGIASFA